MNSLAWLNGRLLTNCLAWAVALLGVATASLPAIAYEVATHAEISFQAARSSVMKEQDDALQGQFLRKLGFIDKRDLTSVTPPWTTFYEFLGSAIEARTAKPYEDGIIKNTNEQSPHVKDRSISPLTRWLMRGSVREDDLGAEVLGTPVDGENDDGLVRVFNHFLDPQNDRGLTVAGLCPGGIGGCKRSADWALGFVDFRAAAPQVDAGSRNRYSYAQAKEALWRAMTGRRSSDGGDVFPAGGQLNQTARYANLATAFRALGSVIHHVQDMAQPQHVRNDQHSGLFCYGTENPLCLAGGHSSVFERYIEARTLRTTALKLDYQTLVIGLDAPPMNPLPVSTPAGFSRPQDYWSSAAGNGSLTGTGLADFTSRSFYSAGTSIQSIAANSFVSPPSDGSGLGLENQTRTFDFTEREITAKVEYRTRPLTDPVNGTPLLGRPARLVAEGAFDQFLRATGGQPRYSLIPDVYKDQADVLLPLAVGYSAGLIDYFFRGEVDIYPPDEGVYAVENFSPCPTPCGFSRIKAQLRNAIPATDTRSAIGAGKLVAVVKYRLNTCYRPDLTGEPGAPNFAGASCRSAETYITRSTELTLGPGQSPVIPPKEGAAQEYTFTFADPIPINASDAVLQIVFRGEIGAEPDGVLVSSRDIGEPSFLRLVNSTDWEFNLDGSLIGAAQTAGYVNLNELTITFRRPDGSEPVQTAKVSARAFGLVPRKDGMIAFLSDNENIKIAIGIVQASGGTTPIPTAWELGSPLLFHRPNDSQTEYARTVSLVKVREKWGQLTVSWLGGPRGQVWDPGFCMSPTNQNSAACVQSPPVNAIDGVATWTISFNN